MLNAVIIDDEKKARETLRFALDIYCKKVKVIGEADGVKSGFRLISETSPDIIFLDIKMKDGSGFDLLNKFQEIKFIPIFITAFNDFAIKAFKFSALDYIVKPVDPEELISAVNKALVIKEKTDLLSKIDALRTNISDPNKEPQKIVLKTERSIHIVNTADIINLESDGNYSTVFLMNNHSIVVSKLIKEFEELLKNCKFMRIHQSHLINLNYLQSYDKHTRYVKMINNKKIPVSVRKKTILLDFLSNL